MEKGAEVWDDAYNVAMEDEVTLFQIVERIAKVMGVEDIEEDNSGSFHMFPTVFSGPVDVSKAGLPELPKSLRPRHGYLLLNRQIHWVVRQFFTISFISPSKIRQMLTNIGQICLH